jgi:hypothetical protein
MDCQGSHILLASEPLEIRLLEVAVAGELLPSAAPRAVISVVRPAGPRRTPPARPQPRMLRFQDP